MDKIVNVFLPDTCRLAVISDIHGSLSLLRRLLRKVERRQPDYLFLLGDFIEKGKQGLETLQFIRRLSKSGNVYALRGNNDGVLNYLLNPPSRKNALDYIARKPFNILSQMAASLQLPAVTLQNYRDIAAEIERCYEEDIAWLSGLPLAFETEHFVFVHAGMENRSDWQNSCEDSFLRMPWFHTQQNPTGKWVIAGHFPTYNYPQSALSCSPLIDWKKKIISIDGGNETKNGGQLNALIIDGKDSFSFEWEDSYRKAKVIRSVRGNLSDFSLVNYEYPEIEIVEPGKYFSKCRFSRTGKTGWCKNESIQKEGNVLYSYRSFSDFVPLRKGDIISVVDGTCAGYALVRNRDLKLGWVPKNSYELL